MTVTAGAIELLQAQEALLDATHRAHHDHLVYGPSGARLNGQRIAAHLAAARAVLNRTGWRPHPPHGDSITEALYVTQRTADSPGDPDSDRGATRVMAALLQTLTGAPHAGLRAWERSRDRTWEDVTSLMQAAEIYALRYITR